MAIVSTTDVCQNVDSTREIPKHGTALVYVTKDGTTYVIDDYVVNTPAFTTVETNANLTLTANGTGAITLDSIKVMMPNLPTSDPSNAGQLWRSGNDLKISTG